MLEVFRMGTALKDFNGTSFRKEVLRYGKYRHPNPFLFDDDDANLDVTPEMLDEIIRNFNNKKLVGSVKYISKHDEEDAKILGSITKLEKTATGLDAIVDVTDPDEIIQIATKTTDGKSLSDGVSVGLDPSYPISEVEGGSKQKFAKGWVLRHLAKTPLPWVRGMKDWTTVEQSTNFNFGHADYTGQPLVPIEETVSMKDLRKVISVLASATGRSVEEVQEALEEHLELKVEADTQKKTEKTPKTPTLEEILASVSDIIGGGGDDDDDEDDDEDDEEEGRAPLSTPKGKKKKVKASTSKKTSEEDDTDGIDYEALNRRVAGLGTAVQTLATSLSTSLSTVKEMEEKGQKTEAENKVKALMRSGKITRAMKDHYVSLYLSDTELFDNLTKNLPQVVNYDDIEDDEEGIVSNKEGFNLTTQQREEEVNRYKTLAMSTRGSGDRLDKISKKEA